MGSIARSGDRFWVRMISPQFWSRLAMGVLLAVVATS
jgi:hypothetical protein